MGVCIRNPDTDEPTGEEVDLVDAVVVGGDDEGIKLQLRDGRYLDVTGDSEFRGGSSEWLYFSFGSAPLDIVPKTTRIIRVTSCAECPHAIGSRRCRKSPYIDEHGCHLLREFDPDEFPRIPAWCPLEEIP